MEKRQEARLELGKRINALRKAQRLSVRSFALMVGLSKDYIIDIEKGRKSPTFETIMKVCSGLDISPAELLDGIGGSRTDDEPGSDVTTINYHATRL